jgi:hypothetical protein
MMEAVRAAFGSRTTTANRRGMDHRAATAAATTSSGAGGSAIEAEWRAPPAVEFARLRGWAWA